MLLERLNDPCSKLGSYHHQEEYLGLPQVQLQHIYRCLDYLADHSKLIQQAIFYTGRDLFNQQLDVVFYDVTTFYFESEVEKPESLRQKGFSKDGKIGSTQVVFAMLIDRNKQPIGYRLYSGGTWEGYTYEQMINSLKKEYMIEKVILVADRGMLNTDNIQATEDNGYEFIMGERLKVLPQAIQRQLIDLQQYEHEWISTSSDPIRVRFRVIEYKDRKIIGTFSARRAEKDRIEREEKLRKGRIVAQESIPAQKESATLFSEKPGR